MRCDRGTTLATILVLMCCIGGSVGASTITTHRVLISTVSHHGSTAFVEIGNPSLGLDIPIMWNPQMLDGDLLPLADIEERHKLPPPARG
jgi:hypothetical protein